MSWLWQPIPAAGQQLSSPATPPSEGWRPQTNCAPVVAATVAVIASAGLFWCPPPIVAAQDNTVTIDKWQPPLSIAVSSPNPVHAQPVWFGPPPPAPQGWHQALSIAAPLVKPQLGWSFVPLDTAQVTSGAPQGWQTALSTPPPVAKPSLSASFVPFDTAQTNTQFIDKWLQPLSVPAPVAKANVGASFVPLDTRQQNTVTIDKWQQPISGAPPVAKAQVGWTFAPLDTRQTNTQFIDKWLAPFTPAAKTARAQVGSSFVPFDTAQIAVPTPSQFGWWQPLSVAAKVARAQPGNAFVPFNTAQTNTATIDKWQQPLSGAPAVARASHTQPALAYRQAAAVSVAWLQPLSSAVKPATAIATQPVWFTPSARVSVSWLAPLSVASPVAKVRSGGVVYTPQTFAALSNTVTGIQWMRPLSVAVPVAKPIATWAFAPFDTTQVVPTPPQVITDTDILELPVDYFMEGLPQYRATGRTFEPGRGEAKTEGVIGKSGRRRLSKTESTFTTRTDKRGYD